MDTTAHPDQQPLSMKNNKRERGGNRLNRGRKKRRVKGPTEMLSISAESGDSLCGDASSEVTEAKPVLDTSSKKISGKRKKLAERKKRMRLSSNKATAKAVAETTDVSQFKSKATNKERSGLRHDTGLGLRNELTRSDEVNGGVLDGERLNSHVRDNDSSSAADPSEGGDFDFDFDSVMGAGVLADTTRVQDKATSGDSSSIFNSSEDSDIDSVLGFGDLDESTDVNASSSLANDIERTGDENDTGPNEDDEEMATHDETAPENQHQPMIKYAEYAQRLVEIEAQVIHAEEELSKPIPQGRKTLIGDVKTGVWELHSISLFRDYKNSALSSESLWSQPTMHFIDYPLQDNTGNDILNCVQASISIQGTEYQTGVLRVPRFASLTAFDLPLLENDHNGSEEDESCGIAFLGGGLIKLWIPRAMVCFSADGEGECDGEENGQMEFSGVQVK